MEPKSGTYTNCKIGGYVLGNCIADEGQSEIYEVKGKPNKVCKIFKKNDDLRAEREIKVLTDLKKLSHPGIVAIEDVFEYKKKKCFFMRRIHGKTLAQRMKEGNLPQDLLWLLLVMWRVSVAMGIVHREAISHRDLKPQNIMLDENDAPVIIDFGLTKRGDLQTITIEGGITGTPRYMAPEQLQKQTSTKGELWDVHALGIIFYEMLYHKWPFGDLSQDAGFYECIKPIVEEQPLFDNSNSLVTDNLKNICACALKKNPDDRYMNAQGIADALWREILEIANLEIQKMTDKVQKLETLEKIFDPAWLGKEKSLELWKGKLKELFNCQRIQIFYLEKSDLERRKSLLSDEVELLLPVLHVSYTHNCIFQQAPEYSLQNYLEENGQLQQEDYEAIEKSFSQVYQWSKSKEVLISLDANHIDFQEAISYSLATENPDSEKIEKFLKQFIAATHWLENWQEKRKKPDTKWRNKSFEKSKTTSDWEHLDGVWVEKVQKENQKLSSADIYLDQKIISLSQEEEHLDGVWVEKVQKENQKLSSADIYLDQKIISLSQEEEAKQDEILKLHAHSVLKSNQPAPFALPQIYLPSRFECLGVNNHGFLSYRDTLTTVEFIHIPKGEYWSGIAPLDKDAYDNEITGKWQHLPEYYIARNPITGAQYEHYLKRTEEEERYAWLMHAWELCEGDVWLAKAKAKAANVTIVDGDIQSYNYREVLSRLATKPYYKTKEMFPVVGVSWFEAMTYCLWANYTLPTESQWEKAGRGAKDTKEPKRIYPWGNDFGEENPLLRQYCYSVSDASFNFNISPYGCMHMVGNIWQWSDDWYDKDRTYKACRGGSWRGLRRVMRLSGHSGDSPAMYGRRHGFRCVYAGVFSTLKSGI